MKTQLERIVKIYPWYSGLSMDLIFYIAINTIWLANVKGFDAAQITFLSTISGIAAVALQIPVSYLIKRLGTTKSIRVGSLLLLIYSIMSTFCASYLGFVIADIVFVISSQLKTADPILIKNNLDCLHKGQQYSRVASRSCTIYSIATMIVSLLIGALFSWWQYLPMLLGIFTCMITFVLSFMIYDVNEYNKSACHKDKTATKLLFPHPIKAFVVLLVFYGLVYGMVMIAQTDGKLFIQYQLSEQIDLDNIAVILGIVIFFSRVVRVLSNLIYPKIYEKFRSKTAVLFPVLTLIGIVLILTGFSLEVDFYLRIVLMSLGFSLMPALRDPLKVFAQNLILQNFSKKYQNDAILYLYTVRQLGAFLVSGIASAILLNYPMQYVFVSFAIILVPAVMLGLTVKRNFHNQRLAISK